MQYTVKGNVRGRVQGVGFELTQRARRRKMRILGWAKIFLNGSVEVVLKGERKSVRSGAASGFYRPSRIGCSQHLTGL
ncbi:MAG: acylphosphatase [Porticoccaceae bacterium]